MGNQHSWKQRLKPFGSMVYEMHEKVRRDLLTMTDAELKQLLDDCEQVTPTNIGWGSFAAAHILPQEIRIILTHRHRERESSAA